MTKSILITTFDIWKARHRSNASDDLLQELISRNLLDANIHLLRKLPVDFELAPEQVIAEIGRLQPDVVVCCGMAERRSRLSVESNGKQEEAIIHTSVLVRELVQGLSTTRVSHRAGRFVCNHLYYSILKYVVDTQSRVDAVFVHVPLLNLENLDAIVDDFCLILERLKQIRSK